MAGTQGPCPICFNTIVAPNLTPVQHRQKLNPQKNTPTLGKRSTWPVIIFPPLLMALSGIAFYLILSLMGILNLFVDEESTSTDQQLSFPHESRDLDHTVPPMIPSGLEEQEIAESEFEDNIRKHRLFVQNASLVLDRFLKAQTLEERRPLLTKSYRSEKQLLASCLNKPIPEKLYAHAESMSQHSKFQTHEAYFTVSLPSDETNSTQTFRLISIRLVSQSEGGSPRVQSDAFIDIYDKVPSSFANNLEAPTLTLRTMIEISSHNFEDHIPNQGKKGTITFKSSRARVDQSLLKAHIGRNTEIFKKLKTHLPPGMSGPVTLTIRWNKTEDPTMPFVEVIHLNGLGWLL